MNDNYIVFCLLDGGCDDILIDSIQSKKTKKVMKSIDILMRMKKRMYVAERI